MQNKIYQELKKFCLSEGAELFGVADISGMQTPHSRAGNFRENSEKNSPYACLPARQVSMGMNKLSKAAIDGLDKAICLGVRLSKQILDDIEDAPTKLYFHHYKTANFFLDQLAFRVANWIQKRNALALPIPASQIVDWEKQTAHLSHKKMGQLAGLGWKGRNNLLINPKLGAQFRLTTILTNLEIKTDKPTDLDCADCVRCIEVCPVGAIKEKKEDFQYLVCFEKLKEFQKRGLVGQYICGICVRACQSKSTPHLRVGNFRKM